MQNLQSPSTAKKDFSHFMLHDYAYLRSFVVRDGCCNDSHLQRVRKMTGQQAAIGLICGKLMS